ncbi:hypothetical protein GIY62_14600 [Burkholderia plantarii]|uniref:hypothetical protein n=1 Tax=Burkholderia plantarii TaxID=41899 RepID=UPI00272CA218|nr:hypothetical protein [Burkholderia plantarii]WLE58356.1 hypothetical protein GIY62_14600 [Burkholderia plantarii]
MSFLTNMAEKKIDEYPNYGRSLELVAKHMHRSIENGTTLNDGDITYLLHRGLAAMYNGLADEMKAALASAIAALLLRPMSPEEIAEFVASAQAKGR